MSREKTKQQTAEQQPTAERRQRPTLAERKLAIELRQVRERSERLEVQLARYMSLASKAEAECGEWRTRFDVLLQHVVRQGVGR